MKIAKSVATFALCILGGFPAWAASPDSNDHEAHHPAASAPVVAPSATKSKSSVTAPTPKSREKMMQMDEQMKMMADMHQKMMSAKTPQERQSMMGEQMKMMQDGMSMMNMMGGTGMGGMPPGGVAKPDAMGERQQMLEKRMDMMQMMMQMMMDRMPAPTPN